MGKVYLSGKTTDFDNPIGWHEELQEKYSDHDFINPYSVNDVEVGSGEAYDSPEKIYEPAMEEIQTCDGMLVKWDSDIFLPGTVCEIKEAFDNDIPIVVQDDGRDWIHIKYMANGIYEDIEKCVNILELLMQRRD